MDFPATTHVVVPSPLLGLDLSWLVLRNVASCASGGSRPEREPLRAGSRTARSRSTIRKISDRANLLFAQDVPVVTDIQRHASQSSRGFRGVSRCPLPTRAGCCFCAHRPRWPSWSAGRFEGGGRRVLSPDRGGEAPALAWRSAGFAERATPLPLPWFAARRAPTHGFFEQWVQIRTDESELRGRPHWRCISSPQPTRPDLCSAGRVIRPAVGFFRRKAEGWARAAAIDDRFSARTLGPCTPVGIAWDCQRVTDDSSRSDLRTDMLRAVGTPNPLLRSLLMRRASPPWRIPFGVLVLLVARRWLMAASRVSRGPFGLSV